MFYLKTQLEPFHDGICSFKCIYLPTQSTHFINSCIGIEHLFFITVNLSGSLMGIDPTQTALRTLLWTQHSAVWVVCVGGFVSLLEGVLTLHLPIVVLKNLLWVGGGTEMRTQYIPTR